MMFTAWISTVALLLAAPPASLVRFDELQKQLDDPVLRILDARPEADYSAGHLPGAVWVDVKAAEKLAAKPAGLRDSQAWSAWLAPLGISPKSRVLVYDGNRQLDAARTWWLLRYLGVADVGLIDGNLPLWVKQSRPLTKDLPKVTPSSIEVRFHDERHATRAEVLAAIKSNDTVVIDARSEPEHTGAVAKSKRGGRIPDSCHLEWNTLVNTDGQFLEDNAIKAKLAKLGVKPGQSIVTHCQGGGRASVDAFAFEHLGFPTKNYYLGWSDWGNVEETPVVTGKP